MKLTLHHINLLTENVGKIDNFYRSVLGLSEESEGLPTLEKKKGYAGDVAFV